MVTKHKDAQMPELLWWRVLIGFCNHFGNKHFLDKKKQKRTQLQFKDKHDTTLGFGRFACNNNDMHVWNTKVVTLYKSLKLFSLLY